MRLTKTCKKCGDEGTNFGKNRRVCNPCRATQRCPERHAEYQASEHRRMQKRETQRRWSAANREKHNAICATARAKRARRTVELSSDAQWMVEEIYSLARLRTELTGVPHEVDHIVPLCGADASGLHAPWNLQVLTRTENRRKHNG